MWLWKYKLTVSTAHSLCEAERYLTINNENRNSKLQNSS